MPFGVCGDEIVLTTIRLINFKCFQDQRIEFRRFSVVIGKNNSGKSSAFEAIRILSNVISKFASGKFGKRPPWIDGDGVGISPPIDDQQRKPETHFFRYEEQQARMVSLLPDRFQQCLVSTHSEQIIKECDESELLRLHRNLPVSRHGLTQSTYDQSVDHPVRKPRPQVEKKIDASILKVVLFGESKVSIWDGNGEPIASIKCSIDGESHKLTLLPDKCRLSLLSPQDVELYVDGECHSLPGSSGQSWAEYDLDLTK
jgi:hypothetical protein